MPITDPNFERTRLDRREFLRAAAAAGAAGFLGTRAAAGDGETPGRPRPIPRRELGKTGLEVSLFGLGTYYVGRMKSDADAVRIVRRAIDHGVNYIDTAPSYSNGAAERRVRAAIVGMRDGIVLATKSFRTEGDRVLEELEASLKRLRTDHVDIFQMHSLKPQEEFERRFGPGGAIEGFVKARKQGKARFLGLTGHVDPGVMNEAMKRFDFDTILLPLNCVDRHHRSFIETTLPEAIRRKLGVLAMKVFAGGRLPPKENPPVTAAECVRYAASLPVASALLGCDTMAQVEANATVLRGFRPIDEKGAATILRRTKGLEGPGTEWYKGRG